MNDQSFEETVARLCEFDYAYDMEAYYFVRDALDYASSKLRAESTSRHVTGAELSEMAREYTLQEFGRFHCLYSTSGASMSIRLWRNRLQAYK